IPWSWWFDAPSPKQIHPARRDGVRPWYHPDSGTLCGTGTLTRSRRGPGAASAKAHARLRGWGWGGGPGGGTPPPAPAGAYAPSSSPKSPYLYQPGPGAVNAGRRSPRGAPVGRGNYRRSSDRSTTPRELNGDRGVEVVVADPGRGVAAAVHALQPSRQAGLDQHVEAMRRGASLDDLCVLISLRPGPLDRGLAKARNRHLIRGSRLLRPQRCRLSGGDTLPCGGDAGRENP